METVVATAAVIMLAFYGTYTLVAHGIALGFGCVRQ